MEIITKIIINSSPSKVWSILTDFNLYPEWNPFITSIKGNKLVGKDLEVIISPPEKSPMTFKPKVLVFEKNKQFKWKGKLLIPGIFDGTHNFEIIDNGDNTTTFIQSEVFKGILVLLLKGQLNNNTRRGFVLMNEAIKKRAEE